MAANTVINLSELDPDRIKQSFIVWLKTQPLFKDYDYTGSNINMLLDLFSRNTNMNAFMLNMVANESFLDSAVQRDSIVSRAKELNYTPRSWRSAGAVLNIEVTTTDEAPSVITIPAGTPFTSRVDNNVFTFTTEESISTIASEYVAASNSYIYSFNGIEIFEGRPVTETFLVDNNTENQRFVLSNDQIDTRSIQVNVQTSNTNTSNTNYTKATSLLNVDNASEIFFIQASSNDRYEICFGDGVLGVKPSTGNIITVSYRVSSGPDANGAALFKLVSNAIAGYTDYTIELVDSARGGAEQETNSSIKYNAPRHYQTQERAISEEDYRNMLREEFPEIRALNVYGGETVSPPLYGRVIISVDLEDFDGVPAAKKKQIENFIKPKMSKTLRPVVVDPDFLFIEVTLAVDYSLNLTTATSEDIKTTLINAISSFNNEELQDFDVKFRFLRLGTAIDEADDSITGTNLSTRLYKELLPVLGTAYNSTLNYQNALVAGSMISSGFVYNDISSFLADDGLGKVFVTTNQGEELVPLGPAVGTVDYTSGLVALSGLIVSNYTGDAIRLYAESVAQDVIAAQNTILEIGIDTLNITATPVRD